MSYYIGQPNGKRLIKRSFKTLAGAMRARSDLLDSGVGMRILRETEDGVEVYMGKEYGTGKPDFMLVKDEK